MPLRRRRARKLSDDKAMELANRAVRFADEDRQNRTQEMDKREQRYAKFRQWRMGASQPWDEASDNVMSDMAAASLRMQDTLYNAVMSTRPPIMPKAAKEGDSEREEAVGKIIDYQLFVENMQRGNDWLGDIADAFTNDGHFTAFVPWVREQHKVSRVNVAPPIPEDIIPVEYFRQLLINEFGREHIFEPRGTTENSWDWQVANAQTGQISDVQFFTDANDNVEMVITTNAVSFDGPRPVVLDRSDVLHPARAANLQIPGPSNPNGSAHVIIVDRPHISQIKALVRDGYYDLVKMSDVENLKNNSDLEQDREQEQKDIIEGAQAEQRQRTDRDQEHVTRYMVFDRIDMGDGVPEEVIYWVLPNEKLTLRIRRLSEMYPGQHPYRPFAEEQFIGVRGRRTGIGLLELMEGLHDLKKQITDQMVDTGTFALSPFFFYRPTSSMKPEVIRIWPGEGYPLSDPKNDVNFPTPPTQGMNFGFNMLAVADREEERVTMLGDLAFGRVPQGKASALRTVGGIALISGQAEARPERILRRFFQGLGRLWWICHQLNRSFLSEEKEIRIATPTSPEDEAYTKIDRDAIDADIEFEFGANVFNTSRSALQESLDKLAATYINDLTVTLGLVQPQGVYNLLRDIGKAWGQDPDRYLSSPFGGMPVISVEDALDAIMDNRMPIGFPAEGPQAHLQALQLFSETEAIGFMTAEQTQLLAEWERTVMQFAQAMQQTAQAAANFGGNQGAGEQGRPPEGPPGARQSASPLEANELSDETLPGAGGGANTGLPTR